MRLLLSFSLFLVLTACANTQTTAPNAQAPTTNTQPTITGRIISVKDGDSLELLDDRNNIHEVRLAHVDCPEKKQAFGKRAKIFTADFCFGKTITAIQTDTDRYDRKICLLMVEGKELNLEIIKAGMGWHFKKYSDSQEHADAEIEARNKRVGLWSHDYPVAPWNYRKKKYAH